MSGRRRCRICGCSDLNCRICVVRTGEPCSWVAEDPDLCSACADELLHGGAGELELAFQCGALAAQLAAIEAEIAPVHSHAPRSEPEEGTSGVHKVAAAAGEEFPNPRVRILVLRLKARNAIARRRRNQLRTMPGDVLSILEELAGLP